MLLPCDNHATTGNCRCPNKKKKNKIHVRESGHLLRPGPNGSELPKMSPE